MPGAVRVLAITEDSGSDGWSTIEALLKKLIVHAHGCDTRLLAFTAIKASELLRVLRGNSWKGALMDREVRVLCAEVVTTLRRRDEFVVWHVDADEPWGRGQVSANERRWREVILAGVKRELNAQVSADASLPRGRRRREPVGRPPIPPPDDLAMPDEAIEKLLSLVPSYSIESWLYQHAQCAMGICLRAHGGAHLALFQGWAADRSLLDEVIKPKEECCLGAAHNLALASQAFPAAEVDGHSPSFTRAVAAIRNCRPLREALERDRQAESP